MYWSWQESNLQSSDPKSDALSIRPHDRRKCNIVKIVMHTYKHEDYKYNIGSDGIRTHAPEETDALNQRLGPLGHATTINQSCASFVAIAKGA